MGNVKIKYKDRQYSYEYDYKPLWLNPELHAKVKEKANKEKMSMNKLIEKLLK